MKEKIARELMHSQLKLIKEDDDVQQLAEKYLILELLQSEKNALISDIAYYNNFLDKDLNCISYRDDVARLRLLKNKLVVLEAGIAVIEDLKIRGK